MSIQTSEEAYKEKNMAWIRTQSGFFVLDRPVFNLQDIAHALGHLCRFNGHTLNFHSVAEHSIQVAKIMDIMGGDPGEGIMHDATEAYLSDVPSPFKQLLPDWQEIDKKLEVQLRHEFCLPPYKTELCKKADWIALFIEAYFLIPGKGEDFYDAANLRPVAMEMFKEHPELAPMCWEPRTAKQMYLEALHQYGVC